MTTTDLTPAVRPVLSGSEAVRRGTSTRPRLTFARTVRSEWIKQWTLSSTRWLLLAVVVAQFVMGWIALLAILTGGGRGEPVMYNQLGSAPAIDVLKALIATAHQANGALLFALGTLAMIFARRLVAVRDAAPAA